MKNTPIKTTTAAALSACLCLAAAGSSDALNINLAASPATNNGPYVFDAATNTFTAPNAGGVTTIDAPMTGSGILLLQNIDSNNAVRLVQLNAQSTYTGNTRLRSVDARFGVKLGLDNALPTTTTLLFETTNQGTGRPVWFDLNGFSQEVVGIGDNTAATYNAIVNGNTGTEGTLIVNNSGNIDYNSRLGATVGHSNITSGATGILDGDGDNFSLTKRGAGTLNILLNFSYIGDTAVEAGILEINNASLADGSDVRLTTGGTFNLDFAGTDDINALFIDGGIQSDGTWGALGSGADNESALITGSGLLNVAVPEPSSLALLGLGGLAMIRRRRQA